MRYPRLSACFHYAYCGKDTILAQDTQGAVQLRGGVFRHLLPLLTGALAADEIADLLAPDYEIHIAYFALAELEERGLLIEEAPPNQDGNGVARLPDEIRSTPAQVAGNAAFCHALGLSETALRHRLAVRPLSLHAFGGVPVNALRGALADQGIVVSEDAPRRLAVCGDYLDPDIAVFGEDCRRKAAPWLVARPAALDPWLGPAFAGGDGACWACLRQRLKRNLAYRELGRGPGGELPVIPLPSAPAGDGLAVQWIAVETLKWLLGPPGQAEQRLSVWRSRQGAIEHHAVTRLPQCPCCGEPRPSGETHRAVVLERSPIGFTVDGGYRQRSPEETVAALSRHISPLTGLVRKLEPIPYPASPLIHNSNAGPNLSYAHKGLDQLLARLLQPNGGKGRTPQQARASGLCEALERCAGTYRGDEPFVAAPLAALGPQAMAPNDLMHFSAAQFANRREPWARGYRRVPEPLDAGTATRWAPAWSLTAGEPRYLPFAYCYAGSPPERGGPYSLFSGNGHAAGTNLTEAILQALLELVERDAVAIWWYNRLAVPMLDIATVDDPYVHALIRWYEGQDRDLYVLDITADLAIPVYAAVSVQRGRGPQNILLGYGAHRDPGLALTRALTEVNQILPILHHPGRSPESPYATRDPQVIDWLSAANLADHPFLAPAKDLSQRPLPAFKRMAATDIGAEVENIVATLADRGMETIVLDLTRPDVDLAVVKVVVPPLRHFWPRFAPGRLYDVPVAMGRLPHPTAEQDLNQTTVFF